MTTHRGRESSALHAIRAALAERPDVLIHRNNTGVDLARGVRYGLGVGSADLVGCVTVCGVAVALHVEVKSPTGRLSREQRLQAEALRARGAIAFVATSPEDALSNLEAEKLAAERRILIALSLL